MLILIYIKTVMTVHTADLYFLPTPMESKRDNTYVLKT